MNLKFNIGGSVKFGVSPEDKNKFGMSVEYLKIPEDYSDFIFDVSDGKTTVTGYIGSKKLLEIPPYLGGGATTIIDKTAFTESKITGVWIPEGVTEIR